MMRLADEKTIALARSFEAMSLPELATRYLQLDQHTIEWEIAHEILAGHIGRLGMWRHEDKVYRASEDGKSFSCLRLDTPDGRRDRKNQRRVAANAAVGGRMRRLHGRRSG
jgi:hypothetical protein